MGRMSSPGTEAYERIKGTPDVFHFIFHSIPDLPEALIPGREQIYLKHFYDKLACNSAAITDADLYHYTLAYSQPGAIRAGLGVYRALEKDAEENQGWINKNGKLAVPTLGLVGKESMLASIAEEMLGEVHEQAAGVHMVEGADHWIAEENPEGFVEGVLGFVGKHG